MNTVERTPSKSVCMSDENIQFWTKNFLYEEDGGIGQTLEAIFATNSAVLDCCAMSDNLLPVVEYAKTQAGCCRTILTGEEPELYHCRSQLESIVQKLECTANETTSPQKKENYQKEACFARTLLTEFAGTPTHISYMNTYQLIIDNWDVLKGLSVTYRLLADLSELKKEWKNTEDAKQELLRILRHLSEDRN